VYIDEMLTLKWWIAYHVSVGGTYFSISANFLNFMLSYRICSVGSLVFYILTVTVKCERQLYVLELALSLQTFTTMAHGGNGRFRFTFGQFNMQLSVFYGDCTAVDN